MIALVSPGQGSQKPGFLKEWLDVEGVREHFEQLSKAVDIDLIHYGTEADEETIRDTAIAQPLIVAAGIVTGQLFKKQANLDESEIIYAGHSVGEITAAALAGVLSEEDAMKFIKVRAQGMAQAAGKYDSGMTAVVGGKEDEVREAIAAAGLTPANINGASQIVAAGSMENLAKLSENPPARARVIPLKVAGAFHTDFMQDAVAPLRDIAGSLTASDPKGILISNFDGKAVESGSAALESLVAQVTRPVRWDLCMKTLLEHEVSAIVELSPAGTLVGLAKRGMKGVPASAINSPSDITTAAQSLNA